MPARRLDPEVAALIADLNADPITIEAAAPDQLQIEFQRLLARLQTQPTAEYHGTVRDRSIPVDGRLVAVREYRPDVVPELSHTIVYMHGGGWVLGNLDTADRFARTLSTGTAARVVSVDYRLGPTHPFPAAFDDCIGVLTAIREEGDPWVGVAGDSAGGNLAAAVALAAPDRGVTVDAQLLIYPALDAGLSGSSYATCAEGFLLTRDAMRFYWDSYAGDWDRRDERLSPLDTADLSLAPPTVIATAGFDPLQDDGVQFALRLIAAGVPTIYMPFPGLVHGFLDFTDLSVAALRARSSLVLAFNSLRMSLADE